MAESIKNKSPIQFTIPQKKSICLQIINVNRFMIIIREFFKQKVEIVLYGL